MNTPNSSALTSLHLQSLGASNHYFLSQVACSIDENSSHYQGFYDAMMGLLRGKPTSELTRILNQITHDLSYPDLYVKTISMCFKEINFDAWDKTCASIQAINRPLING